MRWEDKYYKQPNFICCSKSIVPILKNKWMYCPKCGKPKTRSWIEVSKYVSGWLKVFAWWPTRVAGFWLLYVATVALDEKPATGFVFLKGWSENEGLPETLVKAGIVKLTGRKIKTGFCEVEEAKLLLSE